MLRFTYIILALLVLVCQSARANVICHDQTPDLSAKKPSLITWVNPSIKPKAIILAVHGVTLWGGSFDSLGNYLAGKGYLVVAPDLKGFGRYYHSNTPDLQTVIYNRSTDDLVDQLRILKAQYPGLPIICTGESVGAHLALRLASLHPELLNGLVLSATSTKVHFLNIRYIISDLCQMAIHPHKQLDLSPYIRRYISEDPRIASERLEDPMGRNNLSAAQIIKFGWMSRKTLKITKDIPDSVPVLILQGSIDKLYKPKGAALIAEDLKSKDKTVHYFSNRGHILIETKYIQPEVLDVVTSWLDSHATTKLDNIALDKNQSPVSQNQ